MHALGVELESIPGIIMHKPGENNELSEYKAEFCLAEKCNYCDDMDGRIWRKKDLTELIKKEEPDFENTGALKNIDSKLNQLVAGKRLIFIKMSNSNMYCFYTTRKEWLEKNENGNYRILSERMPKPELIANLTEEQKNNIIVDGI